MSMQDPIADMLTRIKNAGMASKEEVSMPFSRMKFSIAEVLKEEGYIKSFRVEGEKPKQELVVELRYHRGESVIDGLKRVSRPSCRTYCASSGIPKVRNGLGVAVLSTPKGIISGRKAKDENVGGEVLCYVW